MQDCEFTKQRREEATWSATCSFLSFGRRAKGRPTCQDVKVFLGRQFGDLTKEKKCATKELFIYQVPSPNLENSWTEECSFTGWETRKPQETYTGRISLSIMRIEKVVFVHIPRINFGFGSHTIQTNSVSFKRKAEPHTSSVLHRVLEKSKGKVL